MVPHSRQRRQSRRFIVGVEGVEGLESLGVGKGGIHDGALVWGGKELLVGLAKGIRVTLLMAGVTVGIGALNLDLQKIAAMAGIGGGGGVPKRSAFMEARG